jgi:hypothetical protein
MANIRDKIAKLLALAESPNEHEARAALLKARKLMAEHKLKPEDIGPKKEEKVIKATVGVTCTSMTNPWITVLARVIGEHYCCKAYIEQPFKGAKTVEVGFIGLEDDFEVCKRTFLFAYETAIKLCKKAVPKFASDGARIYRERCNAYGLGFCSGLLDEFDKQKQENQEWGLVMVVPKSVMDVVNGMGSRKFGRNENNHGEYRNRGYRDGQRFDHGRKLEAEKRAIGG